MNHMHGALTDLISDTNAVKAIKTRPTLSDGFQDDFIEADSATKDVGIPRYSLRVRFWITVGLLGGLWALVGFGVYVSLHALGLR
ncbi:MAG TPA: hypothetical protein VMI52_06700 [Acetobacteraceae bacterium]|nr:hypothetical protein [Acetobacteraceae bacterium]